MDVKIPVMLPLGLGDFQESITSMIDLISEVRVTLMFRRRDMRRPENGIRVLERVEQEDRREQVRPPLRGRSSRLVEPLLDAIR